MNALYVIMRIVAGLTSLAALAMIALIVFVRDAAATARQGVKVLGYVTRLFATAFTEGTAPHEYGFHIGVWPVLIALLALAMIVSVFTPGTRWFLHGVALLGTIVIGGYARMIPGGIELEILCLPFLIVWFGYYAASFSQLENQSLALT